jgi:cell wall-associated NlpC family hydrolase
VQKLIDSALTLSHQGLTYKYGSDDPAQGGMDCSGAIAYLLRAHGLKDVPRDASGQYRWARQQGEFFAVVSKKAGGFEFEDLQPGDLLFWSGTYAIDRDPPVTHSMIYLGEHRARKHRVMWGSSDGRSYDGKARYGVGVFDFVMPKTAAAAAGSQLPARGPDFLGYARIPGLRGAEAKP